MREIGDARSPEIWRGEGIQNGEVRNVASPVQLRWMMLAVPAHSATTLLAKACAEHAATYHLPSRQSSRAAARTGPSVEPAPRSGNP